ncbi:Kel3 protein [Starmerella bacillaris]|uniref:Kel3 protein n=1 Tax=Starmerella bacillaris TaxID=1247836 RepID=A0AAV5RML6_STABA|nr:Kel3 protein [Starmerella bacillaris]
MAKKDKAAKAAKRQRGLEKSLKNQKKSASKSKKLNAKLGEEDEDIDEMLARFAQKQEDFEKVEIENCERPSKRQNATLSPNPVNARELILFGGETLTKDGAAQFFNDLYIYNTYSNTWKQAKSANSPLPRSSHAICAHPSGVLVMHGGEFSSPKQSTFHHYGDTWVLDASTREWTKVDIRNGQSSPQPRSGHRMCAWKNYILLFGGFRDLSDSTSYLGDLWAFDVTEYEWTKIEFPKTLSVPEARSGHSFLATNEGAVLFGGYTKVKASKGQQKGKILQDSWVLHMKADLENIKWERRKKGAYAPSPRIGFQLAPHRPGSGKGVMFGGVYDTEETEENLKSLFYNNLYSYQSETNRWYELRMRNIKQKQEVRSKVSNSKSNEEDLEKNLSQILKNLNIDLDEMIDDAEINPELSAENSTEEKAEFQVRLNPPHPRFNSAVCVQQDIFYIYCGQFEDGDSEYTFDSFYAVDLGKLDGYKVIWEEEHIAANEARDEEEDDEEDDDEDDEDDEGEEPVDEVLVAESEDVEVEEGDSTEAEDEKDLRPWLPHPKPFETISNFYRNHLEVFVQYALNDEPEARGKDLKKFAFEMARDRWWERREHVQGAEEELEDLGGVEDVVNKNRSGRR